MNEHPVLSQLSVMIDIKLSFLDLWHRVQTNLSYCQLPTLLLPAGPVLETPQCPAHSTATASGIPAVPELTERSE